MMSLLHLRLLPIAMLTLYFPSGCGGTVSGNPTPPPVEVSLERPPQRADGDEAVVMKADLPLDIPKASPMPQGGDWSGVYFSEIFGYLHLVQDGKSVTGKWIRPRRDRWGQVAGVADGNILRFTWKEYSTVNNTGSPIPSGDGYLQYRRPEGDNVDDEVKGVVRPAAGGASMPWNAIKQRNVKPDVKSIPGSNVEPRSDWD